MRCLLSHLLQQHPEGPTLNYLWSSGGTHQLCPRRLDSPYLETKHKSKQLKHIAASHGIFRLLSTRIFRLSNLSCCLLCFIVCLHKQADRLKRE